MNSSPLSDMIDRCLHIPNFNMNSSLIALITVHAVLFSIAFVTTNFGNASIMTRMKLFLLTMYGTFINPHE